MILTRDNIPLQLIRHQVALPTVCLRADLITMAMHVIVAKARFIKENAP